MAAVLVALYDDFETAERVRTELVKDGFPTDRVELTSLREPGMADVMPADTLPRKLQDYFHTLFDREDRERYARFFADHVSKGGSTITVHPRGEQEVARACEILERHRPAEVREQDIEDQAFERAAAPDDKSVIRRIVIGNR